MNFTLYLCGLAVRVKEHDDVPGGGLGALRPGSDEAELSGVPDGKQY